MKVLIIGASGNLGRRLVQRAVVQGHDVTVVVRDAAAFRALDLSPIAQGITIIEGDALDGHSLAPAVRGQDAVINTVAMWRMATGSSACFGPSLTWPNARWLDRAMDYRDNPVPMTRKGVNLGRR